MPRGPGRGAARRGHRRGLTGRTSGRVEKFGGDHVVTDGLRGASSTWAIERAVRAAKRRLPDLPADFRFHDLRHYFASLLIASGLDVKTVQHRLRHGSATTTLNTYSHLRPDRDEQTRAAVGAVLRAGPGTKINDAESRLRAQSGPVT